MQKRSSSDLVIGVDLGKRRSQVCLLRGEFMKEFSVAGTMEAFRAAFEKLERCPVVMEVGAMSPWVSRLLTEIGFEVNVVEASTLKDFMKKRRRKNDRNDARDLAVLWQRSSDLLTRVHHVSEDKHRHRMVLSTRDALVKARSGFINAVRGMLGSRGITLKSCSAPAFAKQVFAAIPEEQREEVNELLIEIAQLTNTIRRLDQRIEEIAATHYPHVTLLKQVTGVGTLTALYFVLTVDDPKRFKKNRTIGSYLGLVPRQEQSGDRDPQLRITKAGSSPMRRLLVTAAHYILGPLNRVDSDLRRFGLAICARGGKNGKKRAAVAVARRLAVLLLTLWKTAEVYEPLRNSKRHELAASA